MAFASPYSLCPVLLFLLPVCVLAQTSQNISLNSTLTAALDKNNSWKSPSGDFAFGFQQIEAGMFLLAIWFNNIREKTIIWSANGGNLVQQGSTIQLTRDAQFRLNDNQGKPVWTANLAGSGIVDHAAMLDTGNFVLASRDDSPLWESFGQPTDTILPTQILNRGSRLVARYSEMNYSSGRFLMQLPSNGNLVLSTVHFPQTSPNRDYWSANSDGGGFQVTFNLSGYIYLEAENGSLLRYITLNKSSTSDFYQRAILEYDGVFRQYVYPRNDSVADGWPMAWSLSSSVPENICQSIADVNQVEGSGACGFNSYCIQGDDKRPRCECPPGYTFLDPDNEMNGCKQEFVPQECNRGQDADHFEMRGQSGVNWWGGDYEHYNDIDEDWCRQVCLTDCFCAIAIFNGGRQCWLKRIPFSNGLRVDSGTKALVKIRKDNSTTSICKEEGCSAPPFAAKGSEKHKSTLILILTMLFSGSAFLNLVLLIATFWAVQRIRRVIKPPREIQGINLRSFTYKELEGATNNFKEELGRGACSTVYKGILAIGNNSLIAVKRLDKMVTDSEQEFQAEMSAIGKTNHKNLMQLLGFCNEGQHRLLVYEYMSNGSLASYLFGNSRPSWYRRTQIAFGTARGLVYLHEECSKQIIHCDIKPPNILLDDSLTARISDFGLAKLLKTDQTRTVTAIRGTKGYVAPEWFKSMPITVKVDVYSFGILLLELICCRKNFDQDARNENQMILADWAYDCYEEGRVYLLVQEDEEAIQDMKRVEKFVMIAIWCIQDDPLLRPTMKRVSQMLEGAIEVAPPPKSPNWSVQYSSSTASSRIIHCDIQPQNILLDGSLTARISDFGLAKLLKIGQTRTFTEVKGTRGYVAPEWLIGNKPVTVKVNIYSFGILLLELICWRTVEQDLEDEKQKVLADWAYNCYEEGKLYLLVQEDEEAMEDINRVEKFVMIAIWCIQDHPSLRTPMKRVSQMLEGTIEVPYPQVNRYSSV
ncbi:hypothetical protein SLEP1_g23683 [Rubroshorea leprosula]|uniref:non-specific serine/threonine protein kinase n=1 Tax=Rubroshorea leprosula TaxID=152421 RepID=A0AAV5JJE0_9ROSI|nr:hypothetical protein SLEP1_g23683 [Rubroshorea leprosula]